MLSIKLYENYTMITDPENTDIGAYEILKKRGFSPDDIAGLAEYLDEHRQKTMQPVLDQIDQKFDLFRSEYDAKFELFRSEMISKREAWVFIAILIGVAILLPEALKEIIMLIQTLSAPVTPPAVSS